MIDIELNINAVQDALLGKANALCEALSDRIQQKLSGQVLQLHSGALAASVLSSVQNDGSDVFVSISSSGVPYAAIQEFGGKTAAHDIAAVNAKALAFVASGKQVFSKRVHNPGSLIPPHSYLVSSLVEMHDDIAGGFKEAVLEALGQG